MNIIWNIAGKDLRLVLRDPKAAIIMLLMPLAFILVLGISLGEERIRVSIVDQDHQRWSKKVLEDLKQTAGIDVEILDSRDEAERLVRTNRRAAVIVFGPKFSERVEQCSFLAEGINPFYRDGVDISTLDAEIIRDETQLLSASIIEQVAQGSLLRVVMPWMIGQAFGEIGTPAFIDRLSNQEQLNVDLPFERFIDLMSKDKNLSIKVKVLFTSIDVRTLFANLNPKQKKQLAEGMQKSFTLKKVLKLFNKDQKEKLAHGLQNTLQDLFSKYDLTAKDWTQLTKSKPRTDDNETAAKTQQIIGTGLIRRGAIRYQKLVPSYTVMFAFFLVLTGGWLFVSERRQGTLKRLSAAPITRGQILLGKLVPMFLISVVQGAFLLLAGKLVFNMSWGSQPLWLLPVLVTTSFAAMGIALLVASLARTETQVAIYGTLLVLLLAGLSGALMGDRSMMPELMEQLSRITPHAWALDAYQQLLIPPATMSAPSTPNLEIVAWSCAMLIVFGLIFLGLSWWVLKLE